MHFCIFGCAHLVFKIANLLIGGAWYPFTDINVANVFIFVCLNGPRVDPGFPNENLSNLLIFTIVNEDGGR